MKISEDMWKTVQKHLDYTDEEMKIFRENPMNEERLSNGLVTLNKTIVAEVVESHGCDCGHKIGDKLYFDGRGVGLLTKHAPSRVCIYALHSITMAIFAIPELMCAGADPNKMVFNRFGCTDVGVRCGGWGHIVMEVRVEDREVIDENRK